MAEQEPVPGTYTSGAAYAKLVAQVWSDPAFKAKLIANPAAALAAVGVSVPSGLTIKVVENTDKMVHLVLPPAPPSAEISEDALETVAAGATHVCCAMYCPPISM
jgi:hypothetical protein